MEFPKYFLCPISFEIMKDPVICEDGNTYDRDSIISLGMPISPLTLKPINPNKLIPNIAIKQLIKKYIEEHKKQENYINKNINHNMNYDIYDNIDKASLNLIIEILDSEEDKTYHDFEINISTLGKTKECGCCYETKSSDLLIFCKKTHAVCIDCMRKHSENMIYQNASTKIKCINTEELCDCEISDKTLEKILDKKVYEEYVKLKTKEETAYIFNMDGLNLVKCQFCESYWDIKKNQKKLECLTCKKNTCLKCNELDHKGLCNSDRKNIEDKLTEAILLKCSKCAKSIYKEDGCNKIKCACGNEMCWLCKETITGLGYGHFCNNCPQGPKQGCTRCHTWDTVKKENIIKSVGNLNSQEINLAKKLLADNNVFTIPTRRR